MNFVEGLIPRRQIERGSLDCLRTLLLGVPDDIAKGSVFLAPSDSGFMTGTGLVVDGGSTAGERSCSG